MALGKIKELHPRDYWKNEALDFTPWLAEEEHLRLLGESIAMALESSHRPFRHFCWHVGSLPFLMYE